MDKKEFLTYIASAVFVALLVAILLYLTYIPVPAANKDIIITVLGVLLGGAAAAMPNLFGRHDAENEKLQARIILLESHLAVLEGKYDTLKVEYDRLTLMLVDRHVVQGVGNANT